MTTCWKRPKVLKWLIGGLNVVQIAIITTTLVFVEKNRTAYEILGKANDGFNGVVDMVISAFVGKSKIDSIFMGVINGIIKLVFNVSASLDWTPATADYVCLGVALLFAIICLFYNLCFRKVSDVENRRDDRELRQLHA